MPTDVAALLARKKQARALAYDNAKLMVVWFGICLLMIEMLFAFRGFEPAVLLMGGG